MDTGAKVPMPVITIAAMKTTTIDNRRFRLAEAFVHIAIAKSVIPLVQADRAEFSIKVATGAILTLFRLFRQLRVKTGNRRRSWFSFVALGFHLHRQNIHLRTLSPTGFRFDELDHFKMPLDSFHEVVE